MTLQEAINIGLARHQAGKLAEAEAIYRQVLAQNPDHPDVLHLLGIVAQQVGRRDAALELFARAVSLAPQRAEFHGSLGLVLAELGRLPEAIKADREAITLNPDLAQAHNNLGNALAQAGEPEEAVQSFRRAMELAPQAADPPYNLANLFKTLGRMDDAIVQYRRALELRPQWPQAHNNLGIALKDRGLLIEAMECFKQAVSLAPDYAQAMSNLADTLCDLTRYDLAVPVCRRALELKPDLPETHNNLGNALCGLGQYDQAVIAYRHAIALRPDYAEAHNNLANAYHSKGDLEQALCIYRAAVAIRPDYPSAHWNIGLIHLMQGDYERGWPQYEWRLKLKPPFRSEFLESRWDGSELNGRRILLYSEQAIGDIFQFFRYVPMVAQRGGRIVVAAQPELTRLLAMQNHVEQCVPLDAKSLPQFDVQLSFGSLPGLFATRLDTIPAAVPYIIPDPAAVEKWKSRVTAAAGDRRKIGFLWAGRSYPDPFRAAPLELFAAMGKTQGNWFCSLQKGEGAVQTPPPELELTNWTSELMDFADTAALMANLDLIITIDTSVAHLAGAMGKPTWVLLKAVPDWRWMLERSDCAWYPGMRLFRQPRHGDWQTPIQQIVQALSSSRREPLGQTT
jgi:tetratricopeptide (TPR) repeat protein